MKKNRYTIIAVILIIGFFIFSYWFYPKLPEIWRLFFTVAGLVIVGVITFLNNLRGVLKKSSANSIDTILHQLHNPPPDFQGRKKELNELMKYIKQGHSVIALFGMGGVGKTALARKLAKEIKRKYPFAQFEIDLKGAPGEDALKPEAILSHILYSFNTTAKLPDSLSELEAGVCSVLKGKRALLFLDNASDIDQLKAFSPPPKNCLLVVTSRQHFDLPGLAALNLERLRVADAIKLMRAIAKLTIEQAGALARLCGCLPLALRVVGSLLKRRPDIGVEDVLRRLKAGTQRMDEVDASLNLSYNGLPEGLPKAWRELAVFPVSFDLAAAAAVWELAADAAHDRLGELLDYSLVEYDASARRYALHDLGRNFAGKRLAGAERGEAHARHAEHYVQVLATAEQLYLQGGGQVLEGLKLFDGEFDNIKAGHAWAAAHAGEGGVAARLACDYPNAGANVLSLRLQPQQWIAWLEGGLAAARRLGERQAEGQHLGNLGSAYLDLGEVRRAIEYYQQTLVILREIGDRDGESVPLSNLGSAYLSLGEVRRAVEYYEQALVIDREIGDRRGEGTCLDNLGSAYADLGEVRRAVEYYEQALVILCEIGDRRGEGTCLGNLGLAYADLGEVRRAIEYHKQHLNIAREIGDQGGEGNALANLGNAYLAMGEVRRAVEYNEQALVIDREIGDRGGEGSALDNLGSAYLSLGVAWRAVEYHEQALTILREIGDRSGEAITSWNLGLVYEKQGELASAAERMQVRVGYERSIGHSDAEKHAARVEQIRRRMRGE